MDIPKFVWKLKKYAFEKSTTNSHFKKSLNFICKDSLKIGNDEMFFVVFKNSIFFIWKESDDLKDWISNFKFVDSWKTFFKYIFTKKENLINEKELDVHHDINQVAKYYYHNKVKSILQRHYTKEKKIYLCGYSRGGGIATIVASLLNYKRINLVTFGQHKVFSESMAEKFGANIIYKRIFFEKDFVTKVPLKFSHPISHEIILKKEWWHNLPFMKIKIHKSYDKFFK